MSGSMRGKTHTVSGGKARTGLPICPPVTGNTDPSQYPLRWKDIPEGFDAGQAEKHGGLYVFWSEAPALDKAEHTVQQVQCRKEQER